MSIIAMYNMKGGVGKTTVAVNLAYCAARDGFQTLLIDLDPQGSASFFFRVRSNKSYTKNAFLKNKKLVKNIKGSDYVNLDILPTTFSYRKLDFIFRAMKKPNRRLTKTLSKLKSDYDLIFIDLPAGLNLVSEHIFQTADFVLLPLIPTFLSVATLNQLFSFLKKKKITKNKFYIFFSMVEVRKRIHQDTMPAIRQDFKSVLDQIVPYNADFEKMGVRRQPVAELAPNSKAAKAFDHLWNEIKETVL